MNTQSLKTIKAAEPETPSRKRVRERAVELARGEGRSAQETTKCDWEQAKRELANGPSSNGANSVMNQSPMNAPREALPVEPLAPLAGADQTMAQSLYELIEEQTFFRGLAAPHLQLLADSAIEMHFDPGQTILEEGSPANRFYLILEGKVVLESELRDRGVIATQTLGPGDNLGWSWLFPPYYLRSSARALTPIRMIFFHGARLREQCETDHELGYQLMRRIADVVIQRLNVTQQRLMDCAGPDTPVNG